MTTVALEQTSIALTDGCTSGPCLEFAWKLHKQLRTGYRHGASTMPLVPFDEYQAAHRTARKRAARAARRGYTFATIDRTAYTDDVHRINTSTPERQGRPMSEGYKTQPVFSANPMLCPRHHVYTYGVLMPGGTLAAYLWLYRSGELAMVSSILGHANLLCDDVMYLLTSGAIREQADMGGTMFYNLHSSGTDGLRFFKARIGLEPTEVEWRL